MTIQDDGASIASKRCQISGAARISGMSKRTLQHLAAAGRIPGATKPAGRWLFDVARLEQWLAAAVPVKARDRVGHGARTRPAGWDDDVTAKYEQVLGLKRAARATSVAKER